MAINKFADLDELDNQVIGVDTDDEGGSEIDFVTLFVVARKSLIWVVLLILLGLTASYLFIRYTKPVYRSSSTIKIDEQSQASTLGLGGHLGQAAETKQSIGKLSGEVELIKSDIIYAVLKEQLNLKVNYYAVGNVLNEELYNRSPFKVEYDIKNDAWHNKQFNINFLDGQKFRLAYLANDNEIAADYVLGQKINLGDISLIITPTKSFNDEVFDQKYFFIINDDQALNTYFNDNLTVEIINPDANTIGISFTDHNPSKARDIVTKIDSAYLDQKLEKKNLATRQTLKFLKDQLGETSAALQRSEERLENFVRNNRTYDVKADVTNRLGKLEELHKERSELQIQISLLRDVAQIVSQNMGLAQQNTTLEQILPSFKLLEDPELTRSIAELRDRQLYRKLLLRSYNENTETARRNEDEINYTKNSIDKLLAQNMNLLQKQMAAINTTMSSIEQELMQMPEKETQFARLNYDFKLNQGNYLAFREKEVEFNIAKAGTTPDFQILQPASMPHAPIYPDKLVVYAIGLAGGLIMGIGLIAGRYFMHNTVTNLGEIERNTRASVLGVVPRYSKEKLPVSKLIVDKNPKSAISESIRSIRTNLEFISSSRKTRLISITSTVSGEGKTFVAVNLGGIIALSNQKVIILDLDLRKPKVNIAFDADNTIGISTILIDKHTVQECIQKTTVENLHFIPAGPTPPNPSELILNPRFDEMLEELHKNYDVIIVDTPPIGLVTDGILVMRKADIPIYIVRADYSKKAFLKNINKVMKTNNFSKLTVILNDAKSMGAYGYGYGYGYEYGYGNSYYEEEEKEGFLSRLRRNFT